MLGASFRSGRLASSSRLVRRDRSLVHTVRRDVATMTRPGQGSQGSQGSQGRLRTGRRWLVGIAVAIGSAYAADTYYSNVGLRSAKALYVMLYIAYQYSHLDATTSQNMAQLHESAATRLCEMIEENKGLYIKLGQAIANQGTLFPVQFQRKFARLYDNAPVDPWRKIDELLKNNLGVDYEKRVFGGGISHEPIASASIAQVHRAVLTDGTEVAVKVQHPYIEHQIDADLWVYRVVTRMYERVFEVPMSFFSQYISDQLEKEVDFFHEGRNSERIAQLVAKDPTLRGSGVVIPETFPEHTTKQVLITEWVEGVSLSDKDRLIEEGYDLKRLMNQYLSVLGRQIFEYGFVHSDPHPGNLIARRRRTQRGDSRVGHQSDNHRDSYFSWFSQLSWFSWFWPSPCPVQELVILDHGLYIDLLPRFRREYAQLWENIFLFNVKGIQAIGDAWGIKSTDLFATLVQLRPVKIPQKLNETTNRSEQDVNEALRDFLDDSSKFPLELIFMSRTMRMMQNLNQQFGSPVNRVAILTRQLVASIEELHGGGWVAWMQLLPVRVILLANDIGFLLVRLRQLWLGDRYGGKKAGIEDYLEVYMKNTAKSIGMEWV